MEMGLSDPGSGDQHANLQMPTAISGLSAVRSRNVTRGLHEGMTLLPHYGMSLKCSESSERARQTGSTALEGTWAMATIPTLKVHFGRN
jgi:hypothetical protein